MELDGHPLEKPLQDILEPHRNPTQPGSFASNCSFGPGDHPERRGPTPNLAEGLLLAPAQLNHRVSATFASPSRRPTASTPSSTRWTSTGAARSGSEALAALPVGCTVAAGARARCGWSVVGRAAQDGWGARRARRRRAGPAAHDPPARPLRASRDGASPLELTRTPRAGFRAASPAGLRPCTHPRIPARSEAGFAAASLVRTCGPRTAAHPCSHDSRAPRGRSCGGPTGSPRHGAHLEPDHRVAAEHSRQGPLRVGKWLVRCLICVWDEK